MTAQPTSTALPKLVVFDMAGTTIDDRDEVYRVLREATERFGANYSDETFQSWMGTEKRYAITHLLEAGGVAATKDRVEEAWQWFRGELEQTYTEQPPTPLPGVPETLRVLRAHDIKVGLTTGFSREIVDLILRGMGWSVGTGAGTTVDATAAGDEVDDGRPAPDLIQRVAAQVGLHNELAEQTHALVLSVGDTKADIASAQAAGVTSVGVTTGHVSEAEFARLGADAVLESAAELPGYLGLA